MSLNSLYDFNLAMIRRYTWEEPFRQVTGTLGNEFNDSWYMCYQFYTDFKTLQLTKFDSFVDAQDIYLSFIFNLLGSAIQIKNAAQAMIIAQDTYNSA